MNWLSGIKTPTEKETTKRDAELAEAKQISAAFDRADGMVRQALDDLGRHWYGSNFKVKSLSPSWPSWSLINSIPSRADPAKALLENIVEVTINRGESLGEGQLVFSIKNGADEHVYEWNVITKSMDIVTKGYPSQYIRTKDLSEESLKLALREVADRGPLEWCRDRVK